MTELIVRELRLRGFDGIVVAGQRDVSARREDVPAKDGRHAADPRDQRLPARYSHRRQRDLGFEL